MSCFVAPSGDLSADLHALDNLPDQPIFQNRIRFAADNMSCDAVRLEMFCGKQLGSQASGPVFWMRVNE